MILVLHLNILCDLSPFDVLFFLILGFVLHNIHAFHDSLFCFLLKINIKKKGRKNVFCVIVLGLVIKVGYIIFT